MDIKTIKNTILRIFAYSLGIVYLRRNKKCTIKHMKVSLKTTNIVLVGITPPPTMDRYFFVTNNIFTEKDLLPESIYGIAAGFSNVVTAKYKLVTSPNPIGLNVQLVLQAKDPSANNGLDEVIIKIIKAANLTCDALGLNFHWFIDFEGTENAHDISKKFFYSEKNPLLSNYFSSNDAHYGLYASKFIDNARLKLDIKPVIYNNSAEGLLGKQAIQFGFNFHIGKEKIKNTDELIGHIGKYNAYRKESEAIMSIYK